jgi:hypothetical protein
MNFSRKLSPAEEAFVIRAVALRKRLSNKALARRFGVCESTIVTIAYDRRFARKLKFALRQPREERVQL